MEHANSSETSMLLHLSSEMADELLLESGLWEPFASERCAEASSSPDLATVFDHDVLDMSQVCLGLVYFAFARSDVFPIRCYDPDQTHAGRAQYQQLSGISGSGPVVCLFSV